MGAEQTQCSSLSPSAHSQRDCSGVLLQDTLLQLPSDLGTWRQGPHTDHSDQEGRFWFCTRDTVGFGGGIRGCGLHSALRHKAQTEGGRRPSFLSKSHESCLPQLSVPRVVHVSHLLSLVCNGGLGVSAPWGTAWKGKQLGEMLLKFSVL